MQILAILILLGTTRRLIEIKTGEGKSIIISSSTIVLGLKDLDVDIITSNEVLAEDGANENKAFYNLFNLDVDVNSRADSRNKEVIYTRNESRPKIVYGDTSSFIGDKLWNDFYTLVY